MVSNPSKRIISIIVKSTTLEESIKKFLNIYSHCTFNVNTLLIDLQIQPMCARIYIMGIPTLNTMFAKKKVVEI